MKSELKGLYSIDLPNGKPQLPKDPSNCWIIVQAEIGTTDNIESDVFTFYVCTLKKLTQIVSKNKFQKGLHLLIVEAFDWVLIENIINNICNKTMGNTWEEIAQQINKFGAWEFDDYN